MPGTASPSLPDRLASPTRLEALRATGLLDTEPSTVLDRLARLATRLLGMPTASVTLVDERRQRSVGRADPPGREPASRETGLEYSYCQHVVAAGLPLAVRDAREHPLLRDNLGCTELGVHAYAGVPLTTAAGETLGSLCVMGPEPRDWADADLDTLRDLAAAAMAEVELRATARALAESRDTLLDNQERLRRMATHDELTGLLNRRGFGELARRAMSTARRAGTRLQLLALDLDGFKQINDALGHDVGDEALVEMAALLRDSTRAADVAARMGGDEFVLLAAASDADVGGLCARLRRAVDARNAAPGRRYRLAASIGVAPFDPLAPASLEQLLRDADEAMYAAKRSARAAAA